MYGFNVTVNGNMDEIRSRVEAALKEEGFGVLTEIDVKATMQKKLGVEMPPYRILGACNPGMAHKAIEIEPRIGAKLPCNVILRQVDVGTEISAIDPVSSMQAVENADLDAVAGQVRDLLRAFINVLGIGEPGTLLCILVEEKIGQLKKIVDAITAESISFGSVLVARYWDENKRAVFTYLLTQNVVHLKKKLKNLGFTLLDPMEWYLDQLPKNESHSEASD